MTTDDPFRPPDDPSVSYFPPPGVAPAPWEPVPPLPLKERALALLVASLPSLRTTGATAAVTTLLGAPLALVWRAVANPPVVQRTASGPIPVAPESSQVFAVDGAYMVVMLVAGAVLGALAWLVLRARGPAGPLGLAIGGTLAATVTAAVGRRLVVDEYLHSVCADCLVYDGTLHLYATAAVVLLPVAMLSAFSLLLFLFDRDAPSGPVPPRPADEALRPADEALRPG